MGILKGTHPDFRGHLGQCYVLRGLQQVIHTLIPEELLHVSQLWGLRFKLNNEYTSLVGDLCSVNIKCFSNSLTPKFGSLISQYQHHL